MILSCLKKHLQLLVMSKQPTISSFFQSSDLKRKNKAKDNDAKKQKIEENSEETKQNDGSGDACSSPEPAASSGKALSPEQKSRMEHNKMSARIKLVEKNTNGLVQNMGETWFKALQGEFSKPYFLKLGTFVADERKKNTIYPPAHQVFSFTQMSEFKQLKVVILGQDPYHGPSQAHGLCFSVQRGVAPPPSLENMYKELITDIEGFKHPGHGYLGGWAEQGVLLLNAVLTVKASCANSHKDKGWETFTDAVVNHINSNLDGVVFMLWGNYAQKKGSRIDKKRHHVLKGVHPSPLSAHRGFFGCKHFSQCNQLLKKSKKKPIDWTHLPLPEN